MEIPTVGEYGYVKVIVGPHIDRIGYYEDDYFEEDEDGDGYNVAIVMFGDNDWEEFRFFDLRMATDAEKDAFVK